MNFGNKSVKHWALFLLLFVPVLYILITTGPVPEVVSGAFDSVAGALKAIPVLAGILGGIGIAAALFWFVVDRAGKAENGISEEEAYYYYDYPDDN